MLSSKEATIYSKTSRAFLTKIAFSILFTASRFIHSNTVLCLLLCRAVHATIKLCSVQNIDSFLWNKLWLKLDRYKIHHLWYLHQQQKLGHSLGNHIFPLEIDLLFLQFLAYYQLSTSRGFQKTKGSKSINRLLKMGLDFQFYFYRQMINLLIDFCQKKRDFFRRTKIF